MSDTKENDAPKSSSGNNPDFDQSANVAAVQQGSVNSPSQGTGSSGIATQGSNSLSSTPDGAKLSLDIKAANSGVKTKVVPESHKTTEVEKHQEQKLLSKYPGLAQKSGGNKFLQKRLAKGKNTFFDSGDYNMSSKVQENRQSSKVVSKAPTRIAPDSSGESDHHSEEEEEVGGENEDFFDPAMQAIPTPDLLFMRRAARHMPMNSPISPGGPRRATVQPTDVSDPGLLGDSALISEGPVVNPKVMARRRATLQVPSKLAE